MHRGSGCGVWVGYAVETRHDVAGALKVKRVDARSAASMRPVGDPAVTRAVTLKREVNCALPARAAATMPPSEWPASITRITRPGTVGLECGRNTIAAASGMRPAISATSASESNGLPVMLSQSLVPGISTTRRVTPFGPSSARFASAPPGTNSASRSRAMTSSSDAERALRPQQLKSIGRASGKQARESRSANSMSTPSTSARYTGVSSTVLYRRGWCARGGRRAVGERSSRATKRPSGELASAAAPATLTNHAAHPAGPRGSRAPAQSVRPHGAPCARLRRTPLPTALRRLAVPSMCSSSPGACCAAPPSSAIKAGCPTPGSSCSAARLRTSSSWAAATSSAAARSTPTAHSRSPVTAPRPAPPVVQIGSVI